MLDPYEMPVQVTEESQRIAFSREIFFYLSGFVRTRWRTSRRPQAKELMTHLGQRAQEREPNEVKG